ncbi:HU family DNA-binding protein [Thiobacillus sp.]|uniref:HU family DNA-binding protein n=1 Tax=Thiobacillus sp. TaxID=924 RepID=UPI0011D7128F|nr:HU family DNA-binding protein [Thiobacillus sp.]TXH76807.1 MAG: HU family DNA-binding protein [Thiobacillus sp.]
MNRKELITAMAESAGVTKNVAEKLLGAYTASVMKEVARGGEVSLVGFGKFGSYERAERQGRKPGTTEPITIRAARVPKFSAGAEFKSLVEQRGNE